MNWLIYIVGWVIGLAYWNAFLVVKENDTPAQVVSLILWTMLWIWICWFVTKAFIVGVCHG